jgi:sugar phosphate isomerase/epimerase
MLGEHAGSGGTIICVENMPPGVSPGSNMEDLSALVEELANPQIKLAIDTGHAQLTSGPVAETRAAGMRLATTHVHDNDGRRDLHLPPGEGVIDWQSWRSALDEIDYHGPILLECIRELRKDPSRLTTRFREFLSQLIAGESSK